MISSVDYPIALEIFYIKIDIKKLVIVAFTSIKESISQFLHLFHLLAPGEVRHNIGFPEKPSIYSKNQSIYILKAAE
jgi:hypothetical protein